MAQSCDFRWLIIIWCFVQLKASAQTAAASADGIAMQMNAMITDPQNTDKQPFLLTVDMENIEKTLDNAQGHLDNANRIMKALGDSLISRRKNGGGSPISVIE